MAEIKIGALAVGEGRSRGKAKAHYQQAHYQQTGYQKAGCQQAGCQPGDRRMQHDRTRPLRKAGSAATQSRHGQGRKQHGNHKKLNSPTRQNLKELRD